MIHKIIFLPVLFFCFSVFFPFISGCSSSDELYKTFFVGDFGTQYFIQPLDFTNNLHNNEKLSVDFTFRFKTTLKDSSIVNISLISALPFKVVDSIKIGNDSGSMVLKNLSVLFSEKSDGNFISRFTTKGFLPDIKQLFNNSNWVFIAYTQGHSFKYVTPEGTRKKIEELYSNVFTMF